MWWDVEPAQQAEFEHWHSHEHFPERLVLPGFLRASRWSAADGGEGFFILYELQEHAALSSLEYLSRLNTPTPWSTRLMPHHRNMVRSQTRVLHSHGAGVWLRTMFRWCGIRRVDQGVGAFRRARYSGELSAACSCSS